MYGVPMAASTLPSRAARRASPRVRATTANTTWPWNSICPDTNTGSSPAIALTSFLPGISAAVSTATTPGAARTASRSTPSNCPLATGAPPTAMCSRPSGSRMSSVTAALPATCFGEESCRIERRTTRSRSSSARRSGSADIGGLPEAGDAGLLRRGAADFGQRPAQQGARDIQTISGARAQIVDRREVLANERDRVVPILRPVEAPFDQRFLGPARAFRYRRHAAERDARTGDARAVYAQLERAHHRGDVAVEALGDLEAAEAIFGQKLWNAPETHEFPRTAVLLAVVDEVVLERVPKLL